MTPVFYYISMSEYDLGHEGLIFRSEEDAFQYGENVFKEISGDDFYKDYVDIGLFVVSEADIYEPSK